MGGLKLQLIKKDVRQQRNLVCLKRLLYQRAKRITTKAWSFGVDAGNQVVKEDPQLSLGRIDFVPGDSALALIGKIDRQRGLSGSCPASNDR